ncbi:MAG: class I SAM-dependent methyltransferase [Verrucomicrobiales bacterium]|jgi:hypothetical protein|nr:class I SAM-dependent methyltransferase [Verrucomicrobiales bacterium]
MSIHNIYRLIFKIWRKKRFQLFCRILHPEITDTLLDVGGYPDEWTQYPRVVANIDVLNVHQITWDAGQAPEYRIRALVGNGCALTLADKSYDIGFSNSVIEHVGAWEQQCAFAAEISRVCHQLWIQTPAYECPIEPHFIAPMVHWLPLGLRKFVARWLTPWGWLWRPDQQTVDNEVASIRLLTKREFKSLFPDCTIYTERLLGILPKSYIAVRQREIAK